jgi:hypothetical protein
MDEQHRVLAVSPRHNVRLASEYFLLLDRPPQRDFVVHVIERRQANGLPLMSAEIVIASVQTRERYPLANTYPLHFRKTYFAARLHGDTQVEYERCAQASAMLGLPPPIGFTPHDFRSCLVPGSPYRRISPFDTEAEDSNLQRAAELPLAAAAGLWRLADEAFSQLGALHAGGMAHGDAELQNFIVSPAPLEVSLIDFEAAVQKDELESSAWFARCEADLAPLLKQAIFLQAALGRQPGDLADMAWAAAPRLFRDGKRFQRAIERVADLNPV